MKKKSFLKFLILFIIFGIIYTIIETIFKYPRSTHWSMFIVGGLMGYFVGLLNNVLSWKMSIIVQAICGGVIITITEAIAGLIINVWLGWNVWHYSFMTFFWGQCSVPFSLAWCALSVVVIVLDDFLRYYLFGEEYPHYSLK